jgi:catechol 2,3-dioxygenase-like lactoylglutathione lyase family enzyme
MKNIFSLLLPVIFIGTLQAQDSSFNFSINHLAISVKDVNRSAEFYKNVLKLSEITNRSKIEGIRWFSFGDGRELHLISVIKQDVTINKAVHLGLSTNRFDELLKNIVALKVPYSDWPGTPNKVNIRADGIRQIFFQDPDGYWIEVNNVQ